MREYLARRGGHGRRIQLGISGGGIGGVVHRLAGIGILRPATPVVVEHYDDFLLLSLFARRSSIVGDIRILCELLIQLRTRIGLDGCAVGQLAVHNVIYREGLNDIYDGGSAFRNWTGDYPSTIIPVGTAVASHHTGTRIGDLKFCARSAGHGQLVQQGDALAVGDDHGILIVHGRAIQSEFHAFRSFGEPHLVKAGNEGVPVGKIGGMASQVERLTRDLISACGLSIPAVKTVPGICKAQVVILDDVLNGGAHRITFTALHHGFGLRATCRSTVAIVGHLNGIPHRIFGGGAGQDALRCTLARSPDLHAVGQLSSLAADITRGHGISGRDLLFTAGGNCNGSAIIDDGAIQGHGGRSGLPTVITQLVRNAVGHLVSGIVGNLNRPGHLVTLVEDGVAHRIFQLHRLPVPHHAGQDFVDGYRGLRLLRLLHRGAAVGSLILAVVISVQGIVQVGAVTRLDGCAVGQLVVHNVICREGLNDIYDGGSASRN